MTIIRLLQQLPVNGLWKDCLARYVREEEHLVSPDFWERMGQVCTTPVRFALGANTYHIDSNGVVGVTPVSRVAQVAAIVLLGGALYVAPTVTVTLTIAGLVSSFFSHSAWTVFGHYSPNVSTLQERVAVNLILEGRPLDHSEGVVSRNEGLFPRFAMQLIGEALRLLGDSQALEAMSEKTQELASYARPKTREVALKIGKALDGAKDTAYMYPFKPLISGTGQLPLPFPMLKSERRRTIIEPVQASLFEEASALREAGDLMVVSLYAQMHVLALEVERQADGRFTVAVINTGFGLDRHTVLSPLMRAKLFVEYKDVPPSSIHSGEKWMNIAMAKEGSIDDLYKAVEQLAEGGQKVRHPLSYAWQHQLNGSCSCSSWFALLRRQLVAKSETFEEGYRQADLLVAFIKRVVWERLQERAIPLNEVLNATLKEEISSLDRRMQEKMMVEEPDALKKRSQEIASYQQSLEERLGPTQLDVLCQQIQEARLLIQDSVATTLSPWEQDEKTLSQLWFRYELSDGERAEIPPSLHPFFDAYLERKKLADLAVQQLVNEAKKTKNTYSDGQSSNLLRVRIRYLFAVSDSPELVVRTIAGLEECCSGIVSLAKRFFAEAGGLLRLWQMEETN